MTRSRFGLHVGWFLAFGKGSASFGKVWRSGNLAWKDDTPLLGPEFAMAIYANDRDEKDTLY